LITFDVHFTLYNIVAVSGDGLRISVAYASATILAKPNKFGGETQAFLEKTQAFSYFERKESQPAAVTLRQQTLKQQQTDQLVVYRRPDVHREFC
jgi:hypothetical protein